LCTNSERAITLVAATQVLIKKFEGSIAKFLETKSSSKEASAKGRKSQNIGLKTLEPKIMPIWQLLGELPLVHARALQPASRTITA
jgi:hypothetical protein